MIIKEITTKNILTKSKLPATDFVINPYVGCPHKCIYCYAVFMKRFTNHKEEWGDFIDIKNYDNLKSLKNINKKKVLLSSVTDPYNPYELKYEKIKNILEELKVYEADTEILTKSHLIERDIELLKKFKKIKIGISFSSLDEEFRKKVEPRASSVKDKLKLLKKLKENKIPFYIFIGPIFPEITDIKKLILDTKEWCDEYYFENLNLRGSYKKSVLDFIEKEYPEHLALYDSIYVKKKSDYWEKKKNEIKVLLENLELKYQIFFDHR